jgi:hypothetical protein
MAPARPLHGLRLEELGDRLLVRFRPRRSWGAVVFLGVWLTGWTFGGVSAFMAFASAGTVPRAFLAVWLLGWVVGECAVVVILASQLFGRELLTVSPGDLEDRREVGSFGLTRRYDANRVSDVEAVLVPTGEDERPRTDYGLQVSYDGTALRFGEGMSESEAQKRRIDGAPEASIALAVERGSRAEPCTYGSTYPGGDVGPAPPSAPAHGSRPRRRPRARRGGDRLLAA